MSDITLTRGSHTFRADGQCARELLHYLVTGTHVDATPPCLTACCSVLPPLNDGPWRDDSHRTAVLMPYVQRLLDCPRDEAADRRRAYRLADIAVRVIAADALDAIGVTHGLRDLQPVVDHTTAAAAALGAARAASAFDAAAYVASAAGAARAASNAIYYDYAAANTAAAAATAAATNASNAIYYDYYAAANATAIYAAAAAAIQRYSILLLDAIVEDEQP